MVAQPLVTTTDTTEQDQAASGKVVAISSRRSYRWLQGSSPLPAWATDLEWIARYGRALPLVAYLATRVDWDTGVVREYSHNQAAEATVATRGAIAQQFRLLRQSGVVTVLRRRKYSLDVQMAPSVGYTIATALEYQKNDTLKTTQQAQAPDYQTIDTLAAPEYQKKHARVSKKAHSLISNTFSGEGINLSSPGLPTVPATQGVADADAAEPLALPSDTTAGYPWEQEGGATAPAPQPTKATKPATRAATPAKGGKTATGGTGAAPEKPDKPAKAAKPDKAAKPATIAPPAEWPERTPGEAREDYYVRAVKACNNTQAAVAYAAHLELATPYTSAVIGRMGKLAREVGRYGLVVRAIAQAGAHKTDSSPLDYVTQVARGLARKEREEAQGRATRDGQRGGPGGYGPGGERAAAPAINRSRIPMHSAY